jgi:predicted transcriptional regulator
MLLSKAHGIQVSELDKKLFLYLFSNKVATKSQIARDLFPHMTHQAIYKRLNKLSKFHFIEKSYHQDLGGRIIYSIGKRSLDEYFSDCEVIKKCKSDSIKHDLTLVDIRSVLIQRPGVQNYYTEALLKSKQVLLSPEFDLFYSEIRPDAIVKLRLTHGEYLFSLEYESSIKFLKRYKELFKKYLNQNFIQGVLYITKDEKVLKRVSNIQKEFFKDLPPIIFYSTLENIFELETVSFTNIKQQKMII